MKKYIKYIQDSRVIARLLNGVESENLNNLFWYDLPLNYAVSWRGIFHIFNAHIFQRKRDAIAKNYDINTIYYSDREEDGINHPNPSVWYCKSLNSKPWFYDNDEIKSTLEQNSEIIISEYNKIDEYMKEHPDNVSLMGSGQWNGIFIFSTGGEKQAIANLCPKTLSIIEKLPLCLNFGFVLFSQLVYDSHILPHSGSSNLRLRYHLGVRVPEPESAKIRVGNEWRFWQQSKAMAFDDSFDHEILHQGKKSRVVLVIDVWHPSLSEEDIKILSHPVFATYGKL
ncbi:aspartyl/asparaginyl beta-hydroxylase domain-containing protein [Moorena sp. SIO4G3]|uniref:aspartyl/asparaginyl beta-hydroxylase domain-containing protein n=1 Tax=Moorena sp. SIO4G3 TaxID=2607821 RepID=UPI00142B0CFD|nr:aspartyl/asparaginyl beta-hydroxylase domain-containing protein [Moorena sp. SIO4G3]NEO81200.1 aspartyl/asparaginyl beta-hydroxylase domain-containing protein [Moorena sp. SIO4G3]